MCRLLEASMASVYLQRTVGLALLALASSWPFALMGLPHLPQPADLGQGNGIPGQQPPLSAHSQPIPGHDLLSLRGFSV
jgi:hypothetical protein